MSNRGWIVLLAILLTSCATIDEITGLGAYLSWVNDADQQRRSRAEMNE